MNFNQEFDLATYIATVMPFLKHAEQKIYLYLWARQQEKGGPVCVPLTEMVCGRRNEDNVIFDYGARVAKESAIQALRRLQRLKLIENLAQSRSGTVWHVEADFNQIETQYLCSATLLQPQNWASSGLKTRPPVVQKLDRQGSKKWTASDEKSDPILYLSSYKRENKKEQGIKFAVNFHGEAEMRELPPSSAEPVDAQPNAEIVDFLLHAFGKTPLAQQATFTGEKTLNCARECAINLLGMGYDSLDAIQIVLTKWRTEHWAGQRNGTHSQFLEFASSQKQNPPQQNADTPEPIIARSQNSYWSGLFQGGQASPSTSSGGSRDAVERSGDSRLSLSKLTGGQA